MQIDAEEFGRLLKAINEAKDMLSLRQAILHALNAFGISKVYQRGPIAAGPAGPRVVIMDGLPLTWERQYRSRLHLIDPLPQIAKQRLEAFVWPDQVEVGKLQAKQKRFLELARKFGAGRGIGVACFGPEGRSTFMGAILEEDAPTPDDSMLFRIHSIGQNGFQRYCRLVPSAEEPPPLSNREMEVLHWMAQGKSNSVIADILQISPSSVDVYVRRIFSKLGVSDRTTAAVKAFSLGLIISSEQRQRVEETNRRQSSGDAGWE
jgi:LuxR family transcriptional regulator/LuxR family quorum-sensing system transcriptional regulator CciR